MKVVQGGVYVKINEIKASRIILGIVHGWEKDRERENHMQKPIKDTFAIYLMCLTTSINTIYANCQLLHFLKNIRLRNNSWDRKGDFFKQDSMESRHKMCVLF